MVGQEIGVFSVWDKNYILWICRTAVEVIATVHKSLDSEAVLDKEEEVTSTLGRLKGINASADCHLSRGEVMTSPPPDSVHTSEEDNQINEGLMILSKPFTTLQSMMNAKLSPHRFWPCHENGLIKTIQMIQSNPVLWPKVIIFGALW